MAAPGGGHGDLGVCSQRVQSEGARGPPTSGQCQSLGQTCQPGTSSWRLVGVGRGRRAGEAPPGATVVGVNSSVPPGDARPGQGPGRAQGRGGGPETHLDVDGLAECKHAGPAHAVT